MGKYKVVFELDIDDEDITTPQQAAEDIFDRLNAHHNDWLWNVTDLETDKVYEVDFQYHPIETTEI